MSATIELENTYTSGVYGKRPVAIVRGSGALLWDEQGREYIDCNAGHGVASIGHGRPEIAAALSHQALNLITCSETFYNGVRARLLERLARLIPQEHTRIFLCNSGTEAVEGAFKFARLATGRSGIVATLRGFHGRSMGALSATWEPHYREPFAPLLPGVTHIRYNDLAAAEQAITTETAAVIIELVQGEGGVHVATEAFVQGLARLCHERGALLIVDEVQTGFGRTGRLFACEHYHVQPDILCLAKALGGGVPMGAICLGPRVIESGRISRGAHGSTFGGNPLACAAALATLDIIEREALPQRAAELGAYALERLRAIRSPLVRDVRGRGLLLGIELGRRVQPYLEKLIERGVLALPAGPNVLRLLPPLVITREQLDRVLEILVDVLEGERQTQQVAAVSPAPESPYKHRFLGARAGTSSAPTDNSDPGALWNLSGSFTTMAEQEHSRGAPGGRPGSLEKLELERPERLGPEVGLLYSMLSIPSYSQQERELARYLVEQARQRGLHAYVDEAGNFVASTHHPDEIAEQPIVLLGHMDTVRGNIPVQIRDGLLYGRGAVDAKGPLAAFLCATARVARAGGSHRPVVVIGAVEEESATSRGARAVVGRYRPAACIVGEPSGSQAVTIGYKGRLLVEGRVTRSSSHSAGPARASSEVAAAFWEWVRSHAEEWNRLHAGSSAFAALMPSLRSINSEQDGLGEQTRFLIGYRLPPGYDIAALREQLERQATGDEIQLAFSGQEVAFQTTRSIPLARAFTAAIRASGGRPTFRYKTGTSDMNVVGPVWGENIVAYGPGDSRLDHTPDEHVAIAEYCRAIDILETVLSTYDTGRGGER
ncbi:MAG: [LysW]-lysine hydrolase [Ktedonobacteraceae bacterium]|nr:[LysW]-lysine hydrolase [Ktedonobacteraceae bacterium]